MRRRQLDGDAGDRCTLSVGDGGVHHALEGRRCHDRDHQAQRGSRRSVGQRVGLDGPRPIDDLGLVAAEPGQLAGGERVDVEATVGVHGPPQIVQHEHEGGGPDRIGVCVRGHRPRHGRPGVVAEVGGGGGLVVEGGVRSLEAVVDAPACAERAQVVAAVPARPPEDRRLETVAMGDRGEGRGCTCSEAEQRGAGGERDEGGDQHRHPGRAQDGRGQAAHGDPLDVWSVKGRRPAMPVRLSCHDSVFQSGVGRLAGRGRTITSGPGCTRPRPLRCSGRSRSP